MVKKYEYEDGFETGKNEPVQPFLWSINFVGKELIAGGDSLSSTLIILGEHIAKHDITVLLLEVCNDQRVIKVIMEPRHWYIVVSKTTGKFADGFYGWEDHLTGNEQIFAEEELPYEPNTADIENIPVATSLYKPSVSDAHFVLMQRFNRR